MKKKTLHEHHVISQNLLFIGAAVMLSAIFFQHSSFFWIPWAIGFLIMIAGAIYRSKYCKCPHCGSKEFPRGNVPKFCPNCGKELNED